MQDHFTAPKLDTALWAYYNMLLIPFVSNLAGERGCRLKTLTATLSAAHQRVATHSISTRPPSGSAATCTQLRAG